MSANVSCTATFNINQVTTTTAITGVSPANPLFGQAATLTATVTPAGLSGSVTFVEGNTVLGFGTLDAGGLAHLSTIMLTAGTHFVRALYPGNGQNILASQSTNRSVVISALPGTGFAAPLNFGAGTAPSGASLADFNGDGVADLVISNAVGGNVSVLLGNGNGTFQGAADYAAGSGPFAVTVGDFNGDGRVDLAVANQGNASVSVLLGNGNGTFQSAVNYSVGNAPSFVAVGDFNGDTRADLAVANFNSNNVSVLLGNGD
jgi:hypothetical protein